MLTQQQIFDKAAKGVIAQGGPTRQVLGRHECSYFDTDTFAKCNIGQLLTDDKANEWQHRHRIGSLEGFTTERKSNIIREDLGAVGISSQDNMRFLVELQVAHDDAKDLTWYKKNMNNLAKEFELCASSLNATT